MTLRQQTRRKRPKKSMLRTSLYATNTAVQSVAVLHGCGESMVKGSARRRAVIDGARRPLAIGLTAQGAELRAAGQRKAPGCARGTAQGARRSEMARGAGW
eukprot:4823443-Pleurochrysis_carterae.AAC.5